MNALTIASSLPSRGASRRGGVYVLVLAAGVALTGLGIATLSVVSAQRRGESLTQDAARARVGARAALEIGASIIASDPSGAAWRTATPTRSFAGSLESGTTYTLTLADADGNLADDPTDPISLLADVSRGNARERLSITAAPDTDLLTCMGAAAWVNGTVNFDQALVYSDGVIGSNAAMSADDSFIVSEVAARSIGGSAYFGTRRTLSSGLPFPPSSLIADWRTRATAINYNSIGSGDLNNIVLGPNLNPYGPGNPDGIYVIDCANQKIVVKTMRLYGTLILINPKSDSLIENTTFLESPNPSQPVLLVLGSIILSPLGTDLTESSAGVNLNPFNAPFRGVTDNDQSDSYPSMFKGVVYVSGNLNCQDFITIDGVLLVGGRLDVSKTLTLRHAAPASTMRGFTALGGWSINTASLTRVVDP